MGPITVFLQSSQNASLGPTNQRIPGPCSPLLYAPYSYKRSWMSWPISRSAGNLCLFMTARFYFLSAFSSTFPSLSFHGPWSHRWCGRTAKFKTFSFHSHFWPVQLQRPKKRSLSILSEYYRCDNWTEWRCSPAILEAGSEADRHCAGSNVCPRRLPRPFLVVDNLYSRYLDWPSLATHLDHFILSYLHITVHQNSHPRRHFRYQSDISQAFSLISKSRAGAYIQNCYRTLRAKCSCSKKKKLFLLIIIQYGSLRRRRLPWAK